MTSAFTSVEISLINSSSSIVRVGLALAANIEVAQPAFSAEVLYFLCPRLCSAFFKAMYNNNLFCYRVYAGTLSIGVFEIRIVISIDLADKSRRVIVS